MPPRRLTSILAGAVIVAGGALGWKLSESDPHTNVSSVLAEPTIGVTDPAPELEVPLGSAPEHEPAGTVTNAGQNSHGLRLTADAAGLLVEQVTLQRLGQENGLVLSDDQWEALAEATVHFQAVRHAFEASIATATRLGPGRYRLEVPAYPDAGDSLRAGFHAGLRAALGDVAAGLVLARLGDGLERHFAGFGVGVQTLEFSADHAATDADYQVTRTMTFWNSLGQDDRLTTRRETHFPGREDPSGHQWGPFLAVLARQRSSGAGS